MREYKLKSFILLVFSVSILFLFTFNVTTSRYMGQLEGKAEDVVAIPIISLNKLTLDYTPENMYPGFTDEIEFYVSNYDDINDNEVLMNYYLEIEKVGDIPLKISLFDESDVNIAIDEDNKTKEEELPFDKRYLKKYKIKVEWNQNDNSYEYAGKSIKIIINLVATQVLEG